MIPHMMRPTQHESAMHRPVNADTGRGKESASADSQKWPYRGNSNNNHNREKEFRILHLRSTMIRPSLYFLHTLQNNSMSGKCVTSTYYRNIGQIIREEILAEVQRCGRLELIHLRHHKCIFCYFKTGNYNKSPLFQNLACWILEQLILKSTILTFSNISFLSHVDCKLNFVYRIRPFHISDVNQLHDFRRRFSITNFRFRKHNRGTPLNVIDHEVYLDLLNSNLEVLFGVCIQRITNINSVLAGDRKNTACKNSQIILKSRLTGISITMYQ